MRVVLRRATREAPVEVARRPPGASGSSEAKVTSSAVEQLALLGIVEALERDRRRRRSATSRGRRRRRSGPLGRRSRRRPGRSSVPPADRARSGGGADPPSLSGGNSSGGGASACAQRRVALGRRASGRARRGPCRARSRSRITHSLCGWRSTVDRVEQLVRRSPRSTRSSFQARFAASRRPEQRPWPRNGGVRWAASPASSTRPSRIRSASIERNS